MTNEEKNKIIELSQQGLGYTKIATQVGLSPNSVKTFLRRQKEHTSCRCLQCGTEIMSIPHKKEKKFCSAVCRMRWWNEHQKQVNRKAYYTLTCECCGATFVTYGNAKQKFCSRKCFANYRRKEK